VENIDRRLAALEKIIGDLEKAKGRAGAEGESLALLGHLIEIALSKARELLSVP
jgi:hypothetical protein